MKPRMEKMAKPARMEVIPLIKHIKMASLCIHKEVLMLCLADPPIAVVVEFVV
jgi:hypothetical protein